MEVIGTVIEKFASKKFGMMALSDVLIFLLARGQSEIVILAAIGAIMVVTAVYVYAVAKHSDPVYGKKVVVKPPDKT